MSDPSSVLLIKGNLISHCNNVIFRAFLECMLEQVQIERSPSNENMTWEEALRPNKVTVTSVSLKNWLNMWSRLVTGYI